MSRLALIAALALGVLAGCSSGDDGGDDATAPRTTTTTRAPTTTTAPPPVQEYAVPGGSRPHDVAVAADGTVWYTAQGSGELGRLNPTTGEIAEIPLGAGSRPHGVIVGPDGAPWVTDGGLNAIVRVDPSTSEVRELPLPSTSPSANLNTAVFDEDGTLWFTGQAGVYGRVSSTSGDVYYASLAGSHVARVDPATGAATMLQPPTPGQGTRRVWADSRGRIWSSQWNAGQVAVYDPATGNWREWRLPGDQPQAYAVYVDDQDQVWLSDFGANALVRFDPATEQFSAFPLPSNPGDVRQIHGRPGEVWGAESAADKLVVVRT